jgi:hypothetical protein
MVVRRVGVLSLAKILGVIYGAIGLIVGFFFSIFAVLGTTFGQPPDLPQAPLIGALLGVGAIVVMPVMYGVMGFLGGLLTGAIYNAVAGVAGGIELEVQ